MGEVKVNRRRSLFRSWGGEGQGLSTAEYWHLGTDSFIAVRFWCVLDVEMGEGGRGGKCAVLHREPGEREEKFPSSLTNPNVLGVGLACELPGSRDGCAVQRTELGSVSLLYIQVPEYRTDPQLQSRGALSPLCSMHE